MKDIYKVFSGVFLITILLKLLDIGKNLLIASKLGVSSHSDIYLSIISIPESLVVLIGFDTIRGVVNSELSSIYSDKDNHEMWKVFSNLFHILIVASLAFLCLILFFRENIIQILLPGFSGEKEFQAHNIALIIFPIFFFKALTGFFLAFFYSLKKFYFPILLSSIISISVIISIFIYPTTTYLIYNLSYGNLAGNFLYFLVLLFILKQSYNIFIVNFKLEKLSKVILKECRNILLLVFLNQVYLFSRNYLASFFGDGAISSINYASSITGLISMIIFNTVFSALLSNLSSSFVHEPILQIEEKFFNTYFSVLYFTVPIVLIFVIAPQEVLKLVYMRGELEISDINIIKYPFIWESLSIISTVIILMPLSLYLAKKNYKLLTIIGSIIFLLGIALNFLFTKIFGYVGISIAGLCVGMFYGLILLYYTKSYFRLKFYFKRFSNIFINSLLTFLIAYFIKQLFFIDSDDFLSLSINLLLISLMVLITYFLMSKLFGLNYFQKVVEKLL